MTAFEPTFLYVKRHTITGLLYFGKTQRTDIEKYTGTGYYWLKHLKVHGKQHIETLWYCLFYDEKEIEQFASNFCLQENIGYGDTSIWANLIPEDGLRGSPLGFFIAEENGVKFKTNDRNKIPYNSLKNISKEEIHRRAMKGVESRKTNGTAYKTGEDHHWHGNNNPLNTVWGGDAFNNPGTWKKGNTPWNDGVKLSDIETEEERKKYGREMAGNLNPAKGRIWVSKNADFKYPIKNSEEHQQLLNAGYIKDTSRCATTAGKKWLSSDKYEVKILLHPSDAHYQKLIASGFINNFVKSYPKITIELLNELTK